MSEPSLASRRQALKFLAGVPMLPLGTLASNALLSAFDAGSAVAATAAPSAQFVSAAFTAMAAPSLADAAAMATTTVGSGLTVQLSDNSSQTFKLAYQPFFITGDQVPDGKGGTMLAGGYVDIEGKPILDRSVAGKERQFFSDCPDGTSLLALANPAIPGIKGKAVFAVVQFEYTTADQAGARHLWDPAVADRRADAGPGPGHRQAEPGEVP